MLLVKAKEILHRLIKHGHQAYFVGGCVRDQLLGVEPKDYDITTSALPNEVIAIFERTLPTGIEYGTITVLMDGDPFEVTTFRCDLEYTDGRRPSALTFSKDILVDLSRRDFTMNAIAMSLDGELVDPFLGKKDIMDGVIRSVGIAKERFKEDKLRKLRAVRFAAQTQFTIETQTRLAVALDPNLDGVSAERIRLELDKLLECDGAKQGLILLKSLGILDLILPEIKATYEFDQKHPSHLWSVFNHSLEVVDLLPKNSSYRWAALLHDIAKPACFFIDDEGVGHFYGHEKKSAEMAKGICNRLKMSTAVSSQIVHLIENHMKMPVLTEKAVKRWMRQIGVDRVKETILFLYADARGKGTPIDEGYYQTLKEIVDAVKEKPQVFDRSALVLSGRELMDEHKALRETPKLLSDLFEYLVESCLDDPQLNEKHTLIKLSREWLEKITEKS